MSSPIGHTLFGLTLARRLGVRSRRSQLAVIVGASLPDADVLAGLLLAGDAWKWHRKASHTSGFALAAGALMGATGLISTGHADGERDAVADALAGALIVGSHIALDYMPFPYIPSPEDEQPNPTGVSLVNWLIDVVAYGFLAWKAWPREPAHEV
ncbi:MAG TPA: metal-dependent hydrolase [Dehalococcoidia bacterium]|nr:metal-dependent hydrolase [Dehalococcoidia bacterium]